MQDIASILKDIFYYVYGFLHNREYREKIAADLKKEIPRDEFLSYSSLAISLTDIHVGYEEQEEYPAV